MDAYHVLTKTCFLALKRLTDDGSNLEENRVSWDEFVYSATV